jgi:hypothetical protein
MAKRRRRSRLVRSIIGVLVVLVLAGIATTIFVLDFHQARTNAKDKKIAVQKEKAAVGFVLTGEVTAVTPSSLTVRIPNGTRRRINTTPRTVIENASSGAVTDVQKGRRSVVKLDPTDERAAHEILVLPARSRIGQPILGTGFGLMWSRTAAGKPGPRLNLLNAIVDTARDAPRTDIVVGAKVLLHAQNTVVKPIRTTATEIVVMPSNTTLVG